MIKVYGSLNDGDMCAGIFVDIMKAYDTVDHSLLLSRMEDAGVRGVALSWFRSYLSGRTQQTKVNQSLSNVGTVEFGIPQGSVLSGPLFLIYVNELCNGSFKGELTAFADDTALFYRAKTLKELHTDMQHDLIGLRWWFTSNFMIMSPKTKFMIFSISRDIRLPTPLRYHSLSCTETTICACPQLEQVEEIKYLGLVLDNKVTWKSHLNYLKQKLMKYIRVFYLLRSVCNSVLLKSVYYALINSKLEYGLALWGGAYNVTLRPIVVLQKSFIRIISFKAKLEHTAPLFRKLAILPLKNLYVYKVLRNFFERSVNGNEFFNLKNNNLRNKFEACIPKPNKSHFMKFFSYLAPKFYNQLPLEIRQCKVRSRFLRDVKRFLIECENIDTFFRVLM